MASPMNPLQEELQSRGLEVLGACERLSARGPELLQNAALLEDMNPREVDTLGAAMLLVRAAPGQVLITEGEIGDWMLLLLRGTVDVTKKILKPELASGEAPQGDPSTEEPSRLAVLRCGAAIGEMSMLDSEPRYATCVAIDTVEAGVLDHKAIALLIRQHPGVGAKLLVKITQLMAQRLRNTSNKLIRLLQQK